MAVFSAYGHSSLVTVVCVATGDLDGLMVPSRLVGLSGLGPLSLSSLIPSLVSWIA